MDAKKEIEHGERFEFGKNWSDFLNKVDRQSVNASKAALIDLFGSSDFSGKTFLDVGSGSGLSSLAARDLGAKVVSFDFDPASVQCTRQLKAKFLPNDDDWEILTGSAADTDFIAGLGKFDIVYSWGVLHHTGRMAHCMNAIAPSVAKNGQLMLALYNDQGLASTYWLWIKKAYNQMPVLRPVLMGIHAVYPTLPSIVLNKIRGRKLRRGMNYWNDLKDWIGGYPFEVSKPGDIVDLYVSRGFLLEKLNSVKNRPGCNEFVFRRIHRF